MDLYASISRLEYALALPHRHDMRRTNVLPDVALRPVSLRAAAVASYADFLRADFAVGADCPLSAFLAAHRFFMASESALRAAALKCGFGLAGLVAFASGAALDSPLIFAHRSF